MLDTLIDFIVYSASVFMALWVIWGLVPSDRQKRFRKRASDIWINGIPANNFQHDFDQANFKFKASKYQLYRYFGLMLYFIVGHILWFLSQSPYSYSIIFFTFLGWLFTSKLPLTPLYFYINYRKKVNSYIVNAEMFSLLRIYEGMREKEQYTKKREKLNTFLSEQASQFELISSALYKTADRLTGMTVSEAMKRMGEELNTDIAKDIAIFIGKYDDLDADTVLRHIEEKNMTLESKRRENYTNRFFTLNQIVQVLNTLPSIIVLLMMLILTINYLASIQTQTTLP